MKIKGRLIATLAALGLLIAMLPIGPASAAVGAVTLNGGSAGGSGGPGGAYFSDKEGFDIVTISVEDSDLSPVRVGEARAVFSAQSDRDTPFSLTGMAVGGEIDIVAGFDGGTGDSGDVIYDDNATPSNDDDDNWYVDLKEVIRDSDGDGDVDGEDVTVQVGGVELELFTAGVREGYELGYTPDSAGNPVTSLDGNGNNRIILLQEPGDGTDSVVITYEYSEYKFSDDTPLTIGISTINYGTGTNGYADASNESGISGISARFATMTPTATIEIGQHVIARFSYDVADDADNYVSITSATAGERRLNGVESGARTNNFESTVALFESADHNRIVQESGNVSNDTGDTVNDPSGAGDGVVSIAELNNLMLLGSLQTKVERVADELGIDLDRDAADLIPFLLAVRNGETLTVSYPDASPQATITKTAVIDLAAPVVTMAEPSPADRSYTNQSLITISADVVDTGAGVTQAGITLIAPSLGSGDVVEAPIAGGFKVTKASGRVQDGSKTWYVAVEDNVGNVPAVDDPTTTDINEAPKGAAPISITGSPDNPFRFSVDTTGPTLATGVTGVYLRNQGVTSGDAEDQEVERDDNREWLRIRFELGDGSAPLDPATVNASDFRVDGAEPLAAHVNAKAQLGPDGDGPVVGESVYLQMGSLNTDARPQIDLVGEIRDRAGNVRTSGRISAIRDGLRPEVTVTPSAGLAAEEVTITLVTSEPLGVNPTVQTTITKPVNGNVVGEVTESVTLELGTLVTWTSKFTEGGTNRWYVVVEARDPSGNVATIGDGDSSTGGASPNEDDLVSFQVDASDPTVKFKDAIGDVLDEDNEQEEGAVWLVAEFDEDEYSGDTFRKVNVTSMTLMTQDGEVITTDVSRLFGQDVEVDCVDHEAAAGVEAKDDKCVSITLAVELSPGDYNFAIAGLDSVGNEVSGNVDFDVVETEPFELVLRPGVNLVSIPGAVRDDGGMLDVMLADAPVSTVLTYDSMAARAGANPWLTSVKDPETGVFSGDITMIEPGKSYFITSTASYTVNVKLEAVGGLPPTLTVRQGYNAIGFMSISNDTEADIEQYLGSVGWSVAYSYDPTPGIGWTTIRKGQSTEDNPIMVEAGKGYLVYALYDSTLTP